MKATLAAALLTFFSTSALAVDVCVLKFTTAYQAKHKLVIEKDNGDVVNVTSSHSGEEETKALIDIATALMDVQACQKIEVRRGESSPSS